jgi:short subunit dehydrogenase-like uncharacterized protein
LEYQGSHVGRTHTIEVWVWLPTVKTLLGFSSIKSVMLLASQIIKKKFQTTHIVITYVPLSGMTMELPVHIMGEHMAGVQVTFLMVLV